MKKIVIMSIESDVSTTEVIKWLIYLNVPRQDIIRINDTDSIRIDKLAISNQEQSLHIRINSTPNILNMNMIKSFWYRRGIVVIDQRDSVDKTLAQALRAELHSLQQYINYCFEKVEIRIGKYGENYINKLHCLEVASNLGIRVPKTIVSCSKNSLDPSLTITKAIKDVVKWEKDNYKYIMNTILLKKDCFNIAPSNFFPTLFQEHVNKLYELRIFFLNNQLFPMAIFSQNNPKTRLDYRNYDIKKQNRTVPYKLPENEKNKILRLINKLNLLFGSIDMIYTKNREYCFLEINPIGQFSQVSKPCNYYLEKKIALALIK